MQNDASGNPSDVCDNGRFSFADRHIGPNSVEIEEMLQSLGLSSLDELVEKTVPETIINNQSLDLGDGESEFEILRRLKKIASQNICNRSFIGMGYHESIIPPVIQRNILENPGWYTQYTPYQAEISQGRMEALLNFQTMVSDLTGMEIANSSLLDEATAAAEAMTFCHRLKGSDSKNRFYVFSDCHPQTIDVVKTRAQALGIEVVAVGDDESYCDDNSFGVLLQYPCSDGVVKDYSAVCAKVHSHGALVVVAADILSLAIFKPPGEWGADVVVGSTQRFGVPIAFGGPHAAYFATKQEYSRQIPGRIIGVTKDADGNAALRLAIQTREQHIRREKATSNICTSQVLLAVMASMYAVYHGPRGIKGIATRVNLLTNVLARRLRNLGFSCGDGAFFDTLRLRIDSQSEKDSIVNRSQKYGMNFRVFKDSSVGISLNETTTLSDIEDILRVVSGNDNVQCPPDVEGEPVDEVDSSLKRTSSYLTHSVFNSYHSETELLRYLRRLEHKDLSLTTSMIPLGSCTMKLNATAEMVPITWQEFSNIHPFAPESQTLGYRGLVKDLASMLAEITGLSAVSLQPNAGSQGEYAGLLVVKAFYETKAESERDVCLIPQSAHGTNPASAVMAGFRVVVVKCDERGNVDISDLRAKAQQHQSHLACLMITYPSTHGVFEDEIVEISKIIHEHGGQVYMDGANLNAQVGLCRPGEFGVDVCHLNLHKTFSIPHGGGGPGVGPIAVASHLSKFLPGHCSGLVGTESSIGAVSAAPYGSCGVLPISWTYIKLMGAVSLRKASQVAILSANYIASRLDDYYPVLYRGSGGFVAHECILDLRKFKRSIGVEVADVAKRLMDYGFHAPTVSFPVVETLMVEPTESESKGELDRFCDAMISIRKEIQEIEDSVVDRKDNVLKNAPHTATMVTADKWPYSYSRNKAAYPAPWLKEHKFWPAVRRIDNVYGDRHLCCGCV